MESPTSNTQALPAGTRLEEFVIERVLGSGGFGITYLARDTRLDRQVVIKENLPAQFCFRDTSSLTVAPRHTHGEDVENFKWSLENFSKEAAMLASLDHPGIVRVHRSFEAFGTAYFVMPYLEGLTFDELIASRRDKGQEFSEEELRGFLFHVLGALGYLHDRGVYHRDLKPGNLFVTLEGMPVLIDFGSARQRLSERSMTVIESAGYTPFEQLQSRGNVGPWSDLYALAATLVKVMTGEAPPKANDRSFGDPWQPLNGRPELAGRFSALLLGSLDQALRLPIEERWQSAEEWQAALKSGKVPEAPVKAVPPEPQSAAGERVKAKHRWPLVVAAVWLGLAGAWWLTQRGGSEAPAAILVPSPGGLVITSEPGGAEVLNEAGEMLGSTPLELKGLPGGKAWSGRVEFKNYESSRVVAEVVSGDTRLVPAVKLKATLQKVVVTSQPGGAAVMQGVEQVGETPFELTGVSPGTVLSYRLSLAGHEESMLEGVVKIGEPLVLRAALKPLPKLEGDKPGEEREFEIAPGVTMTMCWIPPGEFVMGSPTTEDGRQDDEAQVKVTLSKGFWLGKYEVTQSQWGALVGANPSHFKGGNLPVETVSWNNAQDFLEKLNARLGSADGGTMALPTEAQWEYAARVGQAGRYAGGSVGSLDDVAWYHGNSGFATHPVGLMKANAWGLHDMSGNVLEWCADWYGDTLPGGLNPKGPASGSLRVVRGGSWCYSAYGCRVAYRDLSIPSVTRNIIGLRVARSSVP